MCPQHIEVSYKIVKLPDCLNIYICLPWIVPRYSVWGWGVVKKNCNGVSLLEDYSSMFEANSLDFSRIWSVTPQIGGVWQNHCRLRNWIVKEPKLMIKLFESTIGWDVLDLHILSHKAFIQIGRPSLTSDNARIQSFILEIPKVYFFLSISIIFHFQHLVCIIIKNTSFTLF